MSYGLVLWGNSSRASDILILQKKAIRAMKNASYKAHCKPLFLELNILTVPNLYIYETIKFIIKELPNLPLRNEVHGYNTRNCNALDYTFCRLSKSHSSYSYVGIKLYNKLKKRLERYPLKLGLEKLHTWLSNNPFYSIDEFLELKDCSINF